MIDQTKKYRKRNAWRLTISSAQMNDAFGVEVNVTVSTIVLTSAMSRIVRHSFAQLISSSVGMAPVYQEVNDAIDELTARISVTRCSVHKLRVAAINSGVRMARVFHHHGNGKEKIKTNRIQNRIIFFSKKGINVFFTVHFLLTQLSQKKESAFDNL